MQTTLSDRQVFYFRVLCIAMLLAGAATYVVSTIHWQWTWDTQAMHYIVLLLKHGKVPYKDIYDINMPGSYLTERWAIAIFGGGDLGWRLYEFALLAAMALAAIVIALPSDWLAGLFAAVVFAILHGNEGPGVAVERDEVMMVLLFLGYAFLFAALRRRWPALMLPFGLSAGIAMLIKPTVLPLAACLLLFPLFALKREGKRSVRYVLFGLAGFAIAFAMLLEFLLPQHALGPFLFALKKQLPFYSGLTPATWPDVLRYSLPASFLVFTPIALVLAATRPQRADWELWALRLGVGFGAFTYVIQRKAYSYHTYALLAFALLWIGMEFTTAMRDAGWRRNLGALGLGTAVLLVLPVHANQLANNRHPTTPFANQLQADLGQLGGIRLDGRVQCLDMVEGCYAALYRLDLVQSTGFMGDALFFAHDDGDVVPYYRNIFWDEIHRDPPQVIVLTSEWFTAERYSFAKLDAWPQLAGYLASDYDLAATRICAVRKHNVIGYRIYLLKASTPDRVLGMGTQSSLMPANLALGCALPIPPPPGP